MGRVLSNFVSLRAARESTPGQLGGSPQWFIVEFDSLGEFGATITTVARRPIGAGRSRQKGTVTDLDSAVEFDSDLTVDAFARFAESFFFAEFANVEFDLRASSGTVPPPATGTGYTIDAASALLAGKIAFNATGATTLVYAKGYATAANNGVKVLTADVAATDTLVTVSGLTAETPPANASLQVCGVRTDDLTLTITGSTATLVSAGDIADWSALGFFPGMYIHIGGVDTDGTVVNAYDDAGTDDVYGYARIASIDGATLNLDKLDPNLGSGGPHSPETVDVLYGRFVRNVPIEADADDERFAEISYHVEAAFPNLGSGGATEFEYAVGNHVNEFTFNLPLTNKATISVGFIGTTSETITATRKTAAASAVAPLRKVAFSSAIDLVSISTDLIASVSDVCFKSLSITVLNNVSPEKCLGTLGARFINVGLFEVNIEGQMAFTSGAIINAIRSNTTVTMATILRNEDGAIAWDVPEMTIAGGGRELPVDQTVLANITGTSYQSSFGHDAAATVFPVVPQAA